MGRPKANKTADIVKASANEKKSRGKRYSGDEKTKILEQALAEIGQGGQITKIAEKLGVTFFTLKSWLKESGQAVKTTGKRGRAKGARKQAKVTSKPVPTAEASTAPARIPAKRGRKPGVKSAAPVSQISILESKMEELTNRYVNLAHLYGELISKIGSPKI
jgi:transposase-like protein